MTFAFIAITNMALIVDIPTVTNYSAKQRNENVMTHIKGHSPQVVKIRVYNIDAKCGSKKGQ